MSEALRKIQDSINAVEEKFNAKALDILKEYRKAKIALHTKRSEIIKKNDKRFWANVLVGHGDLEELMGPYDPEILEDLEEIFLEENVNDTGFTIKFRFFGKNGYFTNTELWKTFDKKGEPQGFSGVNWKEGKTPYLLTDKAPEKNELSKRPRDEDEDNGKFTSFFTFFQENKDEDVEVDIATCIKAECWEDPFEILAAAGEEDEEGEEGEEDEEDIE
eukprot:PhF_6_TR35705/c0_g1_i2/m.51840/K11290/SET, TAF1, I2PP2A; template-activating factor I